MSGSMITLEGQNAGAYLDHGVSFALWLNPGESIVSAEVTADPPLVIGTAPAPGVVSNTVVFWLSGGVSGNLYGLTVTITTSTGAIFPQLCQIAIGTPNARSFNTPTLDGFMQWMRGQGFSGEVLPGDSIFWSLVYDISLRTVIPELAVAGPQIYTLAVYNLGADMMVNWAPDQPGQTYFQDLRKSYGTFAFAPGVVTTAGDQGTSGSLLNPEFMKELSLANLQNMKTPYGRQYLAWAQSFGPLWGLT